MKLAINLYVYNKDHNMHHDYSASTVTIEQGAMTECNKRGKIHFSFLNFELGTYFISKLLDAPHLLYELITFYHTYSKNRKLLNLDGESHVFGT